MIKMQKVYGFPYFTPLPLKKGVNRHFQAIHAKYLNFCIIKTAIPTKFCTEIKTIKYYLRVVPKYPPQFKNGGLPPP